MQLKIVPADDPAAHTSGSPGLVLDRPGAADMAAIRRWHAADLVASAWPDQSNLLRADADYWQPGVHRPDALRGGRWSEA
jgi:hypothetical protein